LKEAELNDGRRSRKVDAAAGAMRRRRIKLQFCCSNGVRRVKPTVLSAMARLNGQKCLDRSRRPSGNPHVETIL
jgi:hypothetical protein